MNDPNMPKPTSSAARLVDQTARFRIIRMSTSGSLTRNSQRIQVQNATSDTVAR